MMKLSISAFMLLICTTALQCTNEGQPPPPPLRCQCVKIYSQPPIPRRQVLALKVNSAGPHCRNEEIIATLKNGQTCLNPTENWVMSLKTQFAKREQTEEKAQTQECVPKRASAQTDDLLLSCSRSCLLQNWHIHRRMDYHKCCRDAST
ncbi:interleukin-8-like [Danio rerio]|uniref:Interleukin-8-like n=1 Tax=Danio rerio TaxID=7955 RepID=A0AB32TVF2_DANRE